MGTCLDGATPVQLEDVVGGTATLRLGTCVGGATPMQLKGIAGGTSTLRLGTCLNGATPAQLARHQHCDSSREHRKIR